MDKNWDSLTSLQKEALRQLEFESVLAKVEKYCISSMGREIIRGLCPVNEIYFLLREHDLIGETCEIMAEETEIPLEGLHDVRESLHKSKVTNSILSTTEILRIKEISRVSRLLKKYFDDKKHKYPVMTDEVEALHQNLLLEKHISDSIDDIGEVRDTASRELQRIRRSIHDKSNKLRARLQRILKKVVEEDFAREDFYTLREGRFVLPVKSEHKRHISGIIHGVSQTGATVFLEPAEIIELNNELSLLLNEEKREIAKILMDLTSEIGYEANDLLRSAEIMAHIDSILGRAKYSLEFGGIKPKIVEDKRVYMRDIRHPLLVHSKGREKVIPLNIDFDTQKRGHLISGPNAGGKTVALKSMGLNIALALSGVFPIGEVHTNYCNIYSCIGDHQSIENDLSTFSSQMYQLKQILDETDSNSLILVDEIGSGTDPQEGAALAAGILDTFLELKVFFVATTHQSSLKTYALNRKEIDNASLEFNENELKPTYKFLPGIPGNSYAFHLAENLGMSRLVLQRARKYLGNKQKELEKSISVLQKHISDAESLKIEANKNKIKADKARKKFEEKFSEIKQTRQEHINEAKEKASEIVDNANAAIEKAIRDIQEEKKSFKDVKKEFNLKKEKIQKSVNAENRKPGNAKPKLKLEKGGSVTMDDSDSIGSIIEIDENGKFAVVDFNGLKFRVSTDKLSPVLVKEKQIKTSSKTDHIRFDVESKLDIRGMRAEAALRELDIFIGDALVSSSLNILTIVHGKGTGALRKAVQDYLKQQSGIKSFRDGQIVEGGSGVTIVEI